MEKTDKYNHDNTEKKITDSIQTIAWQFYHPQTVCNPQNVGIPYSHDVVIDDEAVSSC